MTDTIAGSSSMMRMRAIAEWVRGGDAISEVREGKS